MQHYCFNGIIVLSKVAGIFIANEKPLFCVKMPLPSTRLAKRRMAAFW